MADAHEVAPCVPGATLTESVDANHHKGTVKIKLGAVQITYRGELSMEPDEARKTIVLRAKGSETRGSGGASGTFTTTLHSDASGTQVEIVSQIDVTGKVAQFGRGIMQDVGNRLIKQFADCLEQKLQTQPETSGEDTPAARNPSRAAAPSPGTSVESGAVLTPQAILASPSTPDVVSASVVAHELRLGPLLLDLTRSRLAAGLRALASLLEPK